MKYWKNWEIGRTYKRKSDGELYESKLVKGKWINIHHCKDLIPSDFLLVDIETKTIGVRRKSDGKVFEKTFTGCFVVPNLFEIGNGISGPSSSIIATPESFMDVISGKFKDDYELVTEIKVVAEYEHESTVKVSYDCANCAKETFCTIPAKAGTTACLDFVVKSKCATCVHEHKAREEKLPDLPPLVIIPENDNREAIKDRLFVYGCRRFSKDSPALEIGAVIIVWANKVITSIAESVHDGLKWVAQNCITKDFRIMTGAEFLREFPGK